MEVEQLKVSDLIPYARNARTHSDAQVGQIAASIKEFGFNNPVLVDEAGGIIAGHGRVMAAQKLALKTVPCIRLSHLSPTQRKAYILADNKLALNAGWDDAMLALELAELKEEDFDLALIGFDEMELQKLAPASGTEGLTDPDNVPEPPEEPRTKLGDIWQLGDHRLMCGDSTSKEQVERLMDGQKADMVFTDPPYSLETEGGCKGQIGKSLKKQGKAIEFISEFNPLLFLGLLPIVFEKNKMNAYVFCNKELLPDYLIWARDNEYSFNVLVWKKPNAIPIGGSHRPDIEYLLLFRKSAIWNNGISGVNYSRLIEASREAGLHPTMKPVGIITNEMLISSNKGSIISDLFGGSGSTLIACEQLNRICFMMELDPKYCDVIIKRWEDFTGRKAMLTNER